MAQDKSLEAQELAVKLMKWLATQKVETGVAHSAIMHAAAWTIHQTFNAEAAVDFSKMLSALYEKYVEAPDARFVNLAVEGYDSPASTMLCKKCGQPMRLTAESGDVKYRRKPYTWRSWDCVCGETFSAFCDEPPRKKRAKAAGK